MNKLLAIVVYAWNYIFDHQVSPVRHIPDIAVRHYVLQTLGFMWATAFSVALGSYTVFGWSVVGHTMLIGAVALTVATLTSAARRPGMFVRVAGRRPDGEHD
jgi:hypothetical protein